MSTTIIDRSRGIAIIPLTALGDAVCALALIDRAILSLRDSDSSEEERFKALSEASQHTHLFQKWYASQVTDEVSADLVAMASDTAKRRFIGSIFEGGAL